MSQSRNSPSRYIVFVGEIRPIEGGSGPGTEGAARTTVVHQIGPVAVVVFDMATSEAHITGEV